MIRPTYKIWADSPYAAVKDPDLDDAHPSGEGGPGKYAKGWVVETEPHEWANFVVQQADINFGQLLTQGNLTWDATVDYLVGSLVYYGDRTWSCLVANKNQAPADGSAYWESYFANLSLATWTTMVAQFTSSLNDHIAQKGPTANVHNTTVTQAGGYTKQEINDKFGVPSTGISNHLNDFNNPHGLTLAQVNCLPAATGGTFGGLVTVYKMGLSSLTYSISAVGGIISIGNNLGRIGIKGTLPINTITGEELVTEASYVRIRAKHEIKFSTREPEFEIPLQGSLNAPAQGSYTLEFSRPSTLNYTDRAGVSRTAAVDEPAFTTRGLLLTADTVLGIRTLWSGAATAQVYRDDVPELWDITLTDGNLITIVGTTGSISNLRIWQGPLTIYEKSTRGG